MLRDYELLQELTRTPSTVLVRARRRSDGTPVVMTTTAGDQPLAAEAETIEREWPFARALRRRACLVQLVRDGAGRAPVMADTGGEPLATLLPTRRGDLLRTLADVHAQDRLVGAFTPWDRLVGTRAEATLTLECEAG
jgi:hypothetical protein